MFGLSFGKFLLLVLVCLVAWYGWKYVTRVGLVGEANRRDRARTRGPRPAKPSLAAEDMAKCRACGAYVAQGARSCGRADCPFPA